MKAAPETKADVVLIGAGIMSATLATLLKQLDPELSIMIVERLSQPAEECSNAWNNAGTGHAALCELNYTPPQSDGVIKLDKAIAINTAFEESKQFWSFLVQQGIIHSPQQFIHSTAHMSFVTGASSQLYLRQRFETMRKHHCFDTMHYSESSADIKHWAPLLIENRQKTNFLAANWNPSGTDVDFGALTRLMLRHLHTLPGCTIDYQQHVQSLEQRSDKSWLIELDVERGVATRKIAARFVFIGAGGNALSLLQKSGIQEAQGYGGFPVSGRWLVCNNSEIVDQHRAKVYSQAEVGAPPMSVPHLDARVIDGRSFLLFGPFAGFTTRFSKKGSLLDLFLSLRPDNLKPMLTAAGHNASLIKYLVGQILQTSHQRLESLQKLYPNAREMDWELRVAGERVQIIKRNAQGGGKLEFGTELINARDNTLAALLGASPGASTSVSIMLNLLERCFPQRMLSEQWQHRLETIFPARATILKQSPEQLKSIRQYTQQSLQLLA